MAKVNVLLNLCICGLLASVAFANSDCSDDCRNNYLTPGRQAMFSETLSGLRQAYSIFDGGIADTVCDGCRELRFLHALTGTGMLFIDNQDLALQDSFLELAEAFGVTVVGDLFDEIEVDVPPDMDGCYRVPGSAPDLEEISDIINDSIIPEIDEIIADLDSISDTAGDRFRIFFTPQETGLENDLEVDYGEVLILKGLLLAFKSLLQTQTAYDIFIDVDMARLEQLLYEHGICPDENMDPRDLLRFIYIKVKDPDDISINKHFLNKYANLLKVLPTAGYPENGAAILEQAAEDWLAAIDYYFDALDYIGSEDDPPGTDPQEDELLYLDLSSQFLLDVIEDRLTLLRDSRLNDTSMLYPVETTRIYEVHSSGGVIGQLTLEYDVTGIGGDSGSLTFTAGGIPSPWEVCDYFGIVVFDVGVEVEYDAGGGWYEGYLDATFNADTSEFYDGTFEYWGWSGWDWVSESLSGLTGYLVDTDVEYLNIDINPVFGGTPGYPDPVAPRDLLPQFDDENRPLLGTFGHGLGNDATLGGILPDMTQKDWADLFEFDMPDLVGQFGVIKLPTPATGGDKGKAQVVVTNQGDYPATGNISIDVYASTDTSFDENDKQVGGLLNKSIKLPAGKSKTFTTKLVIPTDLPPGDYYLLAYIDSAEAITEEDEQNNLVVTDGTGHVDQPDLVGEGQEVTHKFPQPAAIGDKGKVTVTVTNQGNVRARGNINIVVYLSADQLLDGDTPLTTLNCKINLKPGKSKTFKSKTTLPAGVTPGDYYLLADVDSDNAMAETNETNNVAATADTLTVQ
jgi:hypothetical protein